MAKTPFIWLGSKRSRKHPLSPKAALLDVATSRGLPVPNGGILLHELYQLLLTEGVLQQSAGRVSAVDARWLYDTIYDSVRFPRLGKPVAVRAAFSAADGQPNPTPKSVGPALLAVDFADPVQLSQSLCEAWSRGTAAMRRDLLVMEMADVREAGTAVFRAQQTGDQLIARSGKMPLPRLGNWQRPAAELPPFAQRVQQLMRGVRRTFGTKSDHQIEWADDGQICWLLQINPDT